MKRFLLSVTSILFVCLSFSVTGVPATGADRPHVVLVMADDQGWGDMAYNGHPVISTPNFDEAAASGIRFDRFYAAAPVCSPTRASVLTGRNPNRLGVYQWGYPIRKQEVTIAEVLRENGYTTGHFGKWHLGSVRKESESKPGDHGFDRWISAPNFYENGATLSDEGTAVTFDGVESSFIAVNSAVDWMKQALKKDQPVFAVIWFGSPHAPHIAADEDAEHYKGQEEKRKHFYGEITGMDRAYGKLREELDAMGIRDNTILWYCSDNGALKDVGDTGGHRGHKGKVYDGGLLVPSILEWPERFPEHRIVGARGNTFDIFPTLIDALEIDWKAPHQLDGESLLPLFDGGEMRKKPMGFWNTAKRGIGTPSEEWMQELKAAQAKGEDLAPDMRIVAAQKLPQPPESIESLKGHAAWIDGDWKLHCIRGKKSKEPVFELYHLASDPAEERDVAGENAEKVAAMKRQLDEWMDSVVRSLNGEEYGR